jgi:hypothetical protein
LKRYIFAGITSLVLAFTLTVGNAVAAPAGPHPPGATGTLSYNQSTQTLTCTGSCIVVGYSNNTATLWGGNGYVDFDGNGNATDGQINGQNIQVGPQGSGSPHGAPL